MIRLSPLIAAVLLMGTAAALTAAQNTLIRFLGDSGIHPFEIAFFRCVFGFLTVAPLVVWSERAWPRTHAARPLAASGMFHFTAMICFFTGVTLIPLNESAALTFAGPLFATVGAALFLGEKVRARRWAAIVVGFIGVLIVLRPGAVPVSLGAALVLFANISFAGVSLLVKKMSGTEKTTTVVFYQTLIVMVLTFPLALWHWKTPTSHELLLVATLGALCTAGWLCFTRAFALADASAILPLEFTRLPFVAILAYVVFGEVPDQWVWLGAAVIFGSTLYIAHREHLAHRRARDKA
ncbi:MAG: DMT family transporter [Rhodospirillaceae bacterium]|nr:DMT family transporter [Rhodospirillaceae bacterium]